MQSASARMMMMKKYHQEDDSISKAMKHPDKLGEGAKKRKHLKGQKKVATVMKEYKRGTLHSGSGKKVKSRKQAIAIAMDEDRRLGRMGR